MRIACIVSTLALGTAFAVSGTSVPIPTAADGEWVGDGAWSGPGMGSGAYDVRTTVSGDTWTTAYDYPGSEARASTHVTRFVPRGDGFFDVHDADGRKVGDGYCVLGECAYEASYDGVALRETVRIEGDRIHRLGHKSGEGFRVAWKETLARR